jgi:uncharacterized membrane protein YkoI
MKPTLTPLLTGALLLSATVALPAAADDDDMDMAQMRAVSSASGLISPEQAIEKALAAKAGTVNEAELERKMGKYYYEIEVVDAQGVEWDIDLDAVTGDVKRIKRDSDLF